MAKLMRCAREFAPKPGGGSSSAPPTANMVIRLLPIAWARCSTSRIPIGPGGPDITYVPTQEGWLYLAAVIDLCTRKIVGWATGDSLRAVLVCEALRVALV